MAQTLNIKNFVAGIDIEPDEYLLPLLEVIVNAIQGIEDTGNPSNGEITIKVIRGKQLSLKGNIEEPYSPIVGFEVIDNGVGFVAKRFQAFNDAFTDLNKSKGCKGVGRYTVLACFNSMEVNSTFYETKSWWNRFFKFDTVNGINPENDENKIESKEETLKTVIKLNDYKKYFSDYINENKIGLQHIGEGIIQHCLLYFITNAVPKIRIYNENESVDNSLSLNDLYRKIIKFDNGSNNDAKLCKMKGIQQVFNLDYIRNYNSKSHSFHLCANNREVGKKISILNNIPAFVQSLIDNEGEKYYLSVYVTSDFLDKKANSMKLA